MFAHIQNGANYAKIFDTCLYSERFLSAESIQQGRNVSFLFIKTLLQVIYLCM